MAVVKGRDSRLMCNGLVPSSLGQLWALFGPKTMIGVVNFLDLVENIGHIKKYDDQISFDIISKCINLVKKKYVQHWIATAA